MTPPKSDDENLNIDEGLHIETDVSQLTSMTKPNLAGHSWRQQGPYIICKTCPIEHALFIGMDHQLIGLNDDGSPILKKIG